VVLRTAATWLRVRSLLADVYAFAHDHPATVVAAVISIGMASAVLAARPPAARVCACGHTVAAHEHYRRGTECSANGCDCPRVHE
jgi:hypothetical protein